MKFYRTRSSFDAFEGRVHVEDRWLVELASSEEEAIESSKKYLKMMGYTNVCVTECHLETNEEKYNKKYAIWNGGGEPDAKEKQGERLDKENSAAPPMASKSVQRQEFSDDLF